jgi:hypothetical protein
MCIETGEWETKRIAASGGPAEKVVDGFFRGDWIRKPDGTGTLMVTTGGGGGLRVVDVERRSIVWQDSKVTGALPMFSADGNAISIVYPESRDRDAIWVYDAATGKGRVAVRFPQPFHILFRASWVDDGRAFVVNRQETPSHIVMFDRFWTGGGATAR